jgi:phosphatidylglycerophosphate synthase
LGDIPLWFLISLLLRDLLILAGGLFIKIKKGTVPPSNPTGKWTVGLVALTLCAAVLGIGTSMLVWLIWISIAGLVLSLAGYGIRFVKELRSPVTSDTA